MQPNAKARRPREWLVPVVGVTLLAALAFLLWMRLQGGSGLEARHRAWLEAFVAEQRGRRAGGAAEQEEIVLGVLARSRSFAITGVTVGVGLDGRGNTCWALEVVAPDGARTGVVIGLSDTEAGVRVAGSGLEPRCRCPAGSRRRGGVVQC